MLSHPIDRLDLVDSGAERSLREEIDTLVRSNLPEFMFWASPGNWRWHHVYEVAPDLQIAACTQAGEVIGAVNALPVPLDAPEQLAGQGYDSVLVDAKVNAGQPARSVCLLSLSIRPEHRKSGLAERLLQEVFARARRMSARNIIAPLRPTKKARYPHVPMSEFILWRDSDGEAFDPWIRTHLELGGTIACVAESSLVVRQPVARWEAATGQRMRVPGTYTVAGALSPVVVDLQGVGTYCEDNVWIVHSLEGN